MLAKVAAVAVANKIARVPLGGADQRDLSCATDRRDIGGKLKSKKLSNAGHKPTARLKK